MRIPIKRYVPDEDALDAANHLLGEAVDGPGLLVARELVRLLIHHEQETKWMVERIKELEQATKT